MGSAGVQVLLDCGLSTSRNLLAQHAQEESIDSHHNKTTGKAIVDVAGLIQQVTNHAQTVGTDDTTHAEIHTPDLVTDHENNTVIVADAEQGDIHTELIDTQVVASTTTVGTTHQGLLASDRGGAETGLGAEETADAQVLGGSPAEILETSSGGGGSSQEVLGAQALLEAEIGAVAAAGQTTLAPDESNEGGVADDVDEVGNGVLTIPVSAI